MAKYKIANEVTLAAGEVCLDIPDGNIVLPTDAMIVDSDGSEHPLVVISEPLGCLPSASSHRDEKGRFIHRGPGGEILTVAIIKGDDRRNVNEHELDDWLAKGWSKE